MFPSSAIFPQQLPTHNTFSDCLGCQRFIPRALVYGGATTLRVLITDVYPYRCAGVPHKVLSKCTATTRVEGLIQARPGDSLRPWSPSQVCCLFERLGVKAAQEADHNVRIRTFQETDYDPNCSLHSRWPIVVKTNTYVLAHTHTRGELRNVSCHGEAYCGFLLQLELIPILFGRDRVMH